MENASKAILIAGGILIAIVTITIFLFVFGTSGQMVGVTQEDTLTKELVDFNKSYEAYNKKKMYGTDMISILNKAIDNNRSWNVEYGENSPKKDYLDYYVDIEIKYYARSELPVRKYWNNTTT